VDLGGQDHIIAPSPGQRLPDDDLGLALRVDVSGIDEVDPGVQRRVDRRDRLFMVRLAPRAKHHGAQAKRADLDSGSS
jgi:hypothetical protein